MDLSGARPPEESRTMRESPARPQANNTKDANTKGLMEQAVQRPSELPDSGGALASPHTESGSLRDLAEPRDTRDHNSIAELMRRLGQEGNPVGSTRLAIEVDEQTHEPKFLILSKETGEVIRTVPPEDVVPMLSELSRQYGTVFDRRV